MQRSGKLSETQGTAQSSETPRYMIPCHGMMNTPHLIPNVQTGREGMFHGGPSRVTNEGMPSAQQIESNRDSRNATGNAHIGSAESRT